MSSHCHIRARALIATGALAVLLAVPAVEAHAAPRAAQLKGTIVGAPYVASARSTALPVLISKQSMKRARLKSPIGVLIVPRRRTVSTPDGRVLPGNLRLGDRWKGRARISRANRRELYTRIALKRIDVYRRSKALSTAELKALVKELRRDLARLAGYVTDLGDYTQRGFRDVNARLAGLRSDVDGLRRDVSALRADLNALSARLDAAIAGLESTVSTVTTELQPQVQQLITSLTTIGDVIGGAGCPSTPGSINARVCAVELVTVPQVSTVTSRVDQVSSALTTLVNRLTNVTLSGDLPAELTPTVSATLSSVYGLIGQVGGLLPQVSSLTDAQASAGVAISDLQGLVGSINVTTIDGRLTKLLGDLGADPATGAISGLTPALLTAVQSQADQLQGILAGADLTLGNADDLAALIAAANGNIATLTSGQQTLADKLDVICGDWYTALSGTKAPVVDLAGLRIGDALLPPLTACPA